MYALSASRNAAVIVFCGFLYACGGNDVGKQEGVGPQAVVTVIGQPYVPASTGRAAAATIRAQTEVTLSAKDSIDGSAPITEFTFKQTDSNPVLPLIVKTRNTVTFTAPTVSQDSTYKFTLTVKDSNGKTSSADVNFSVRAVLDQNSFLSYLSTPNTYTVEAVPTITIAGNAAAAADATLGTFTITVQRALTYTDRAGRVHTDVPLDVAPNTLPLKIQGSWPTRTGASAVCGSSVNPRFTLDIPALDADDLNVLVQNGDRTNQLELADIDTADLRLQIAIASDSGSLVPGVCVSGANSSTPAIQIAEGAALKTFAASAQPSAVPSGTVSVTTLRGDPIAGGASSASFDSAASAVAYYKAIGEENTKKTFFAWLRANGFDPAATNYGADAHAVYTNDFDLGFGRDMYMKVRNCNPSTLNIGSCDVASVVVNYASMEAAAKKLGPINAVAMEYSATPTSNSKRIVKFYAYAPDPRDAAGDFRRVHSVNLDSRGEKSVPGSCTICHGGTPQGLAAGVYGNGGDLNSAFLLWDLDTLLYSDKDPSFSTAVADAALKAKLTRSEQEPELRKLNAGAYLTMLDQVPGRFTLARELVSGWYTANALPVQRLDQVLSGSHTGGFVPNGWKAAGVDKVAGTADDNPASAADLYSKVYASYCRTCHVPQVPKLNAAVYEPFNTCDTPTAPYAGGGEHQLAFGCYGQFVNAQSLLDQLRRAQMPNARLTMDRFWVNAGGESAARTLAKHLVTVGKLTGADATAPETSVAPQATAVLEAASVFDAAAEATATRVPFDNTAAISITRGKTVRLLGGASILARTYGWSVTRGGSAVALAGASTSSPTFIANQPGTYLVSFSVNGGSVLSRSVVVPDWEPVAHADPDTGVLSAAPAQVRVIAVLQNDRARIKGTTTESPLSSGDGGYKVRLCAPTATCSDTITSVAYNVTVLSDNSLSFVATVAGVGTQRLNYWLVDVDGDSSTATVDVTVAAALAIAPPGTCDIAVKSAGSASVNFNSRISGGLSPYAVSIAVNPLHGTIGALTGNVGTYQAAPLIADTTTTPKIYVGTDTFSFGVTDSAPVAGVGTAKVEIQAQAPWTNGTTSGVKNIWASVGCTGCHAAVVSPSGGMDLVTNNGYGIGTDTKSLFAASSLRVVTANPTTSKILRCPSHFDQLGVKQPGETALCASGHGGANQTLTFAQHQLILRWIQEGAPQNDKAAFVCAALP